MWDDVQRFLDYLITQYGVGRVILAPFSIIGLLAAVGVITGGSVSFIAVGSSIFVAIVFISTLSLQLRRVSELLRERTRVVNLYTDRFVRSESRAYTVEDWDEFVTVNRNGDTTLEKWITIRVGDEDLYSAWSWVYKTGIWKSSQIGASERRRIKVEARGFDENRNLGARYDVTQEWEDNRLQLFIHFEDTAPAGAIVRVWIRWVWPRYYKALFDGGTEVVEWLMHRQAKRISTTMSFDPKCAPKGNFNISPHTGCPVPAQTRTPDGRVMITAEYLAVPVGVKFGFKLDGRAPRA